MIYDVFFAVCMRNVLWDCLPRKNPAQSRADKDFSLSLSLFCGSCSAEDLFFLSRFSSKDSLSGRSGSVQVRAHTRRC